jgi:hypothetical protein
MNTGHKPAIITVEHSTETVRRCSIDINAAVEPGGVV